MEAINIWNVKDFMRFVFTYNEDFYYEVLRLRSGRIVGFLPQNEFIAKLISAPYISLN